MKGPRSNFFDFYYFSNWTNGKDGMATKNFQDQLIYKKTTIAKLEICRKISLLMYIMAVDRILYIKLRLKQIQLVKEIFIQDLEAGLEVYIPNELKIQHLPLSYQFYDSTFNLINES